MISKGSCYLQEGEYAIAGVNPMVIYKVISVKRMIDRQVVVTGKIYGHWSMVNGSTLTFEVSDVVKVLSNKEIDLFFLRQ